MIKYELFNLSLDHQSKFNSTQANVDKDMGELRKDFEKIEAISALLHFRLLILINDSGGCRISC